MQTKELEGKRKVGAGLKLYNLIGSYYLWLLCIVLGLVVYMTGADSYVRARNIYFVAAFLFLVLFFREFRFKRLVPLKIPLILFAIVVIFAYLSLLNAARIDWTLKYINFNLWLSLFFLIFSYFMMLAFSRKHTNFFVFLIGLALVIIEIITIKIWLAHGGWPYRSAIGLTGVIIFGTWLLLGLAFGYASIFVFKGPWKILGFLLLILALASLVANNTRTFFLALPFMLILPAFIIKYKYKATIIIVCIIALIALFIGFYNYSGKLNPRFDAKAMVKNIHTVWSVAPGEMGRFDVNCATSNLCSKFSYPLDKKVHFEESSLIRLSLLKSILLAIKENPFRPNGYYPREFVYNLEKNFWDYKDVRYPFAYVPAHDTDIKDGNPHTYIHPHDSAVSAIFELGIIGALAIYLFTIFMFYVGVYIYRHNRGVYKFWGMFLCIFLLGESISFFFDWLILFAAQMVLFVFYGITLGIYAKTLLDKKLKRGYFKSL
ncbi:hypothetical protein BKH43_07195 [Helicobacter sp. 13S00401-1]|uniref:O-antigen ligase family protein n=1 Tax=Helicobacter sp. 13S00401-1 TaxID=1905758 RepID=UPI000BA5D25B|nr:O-antigen ligase family protein [Helicobacter sp. 13S00401-1]PAF49303.1 hypothetical protein BKH43_07195 [Helicobacter sp. 13S00401-1]